MSCFHVHHNSDVLLLADPNPESQLALQRSLVAVGYEVYLIGSGSEALTLAQQQLPALLLLDVDLPDISGFEVCRQLKDTARTRSIPVIFLGAGDRKQDRLQAFHLGATDFMTRPLWPEEVLARVQTHLATARLQRQLQDQTRRALAARGQPHPLITNLQRTLNQQARILKEKNDLLQKEVQERRRVEEALRLEKQKSEKLLLNILPHAIVQKLKQFEGSLAERFEEATVLFADIVSFTPLAAQVSPLSLVNLLNQIFSEFDRLAQKHQLEKIKTIGDAYMVVGGLPVPCSDHAQAVMEMALEMQTAIQQFTRQDGTPLQLRIGVNTGTVVAGVIGIQKFSYDLWGDTVNVASRMEAQGVPGKIQVTETTYNRLKDRYEFESGGQVLIKGKGYMSAYHLVGRR